MKIFRKTVPNQVFNNDIRLSSLQWEILNTHVASFNNISFKDARIDGNHANESPHTFQYAKFLQKSFVYLITETFGDHPYPYFTEKTWKAINTGVPFLMIGPQNSLAKLQEFGFKTFSSWWDEGYDKLPYVSNRIESVISIVERFSSYSMDELYQIKIEMLPVLEYNQKHMKNFIDVSLKNIADSI